MPLPPSDETCLELSIDLSFLLSLGIELPGGISIMPKFDPGEIPNFGTVIAKLLGELNAALAPLVPFFRLLDVVIALIECVKAIPDSLGPPPDPTKIVKCIAKLTAAASFLLKLFPPLSIPITIVGICKVIIGGLKAVIESLELTISVNLELDLALQRASLLAEDPELLEGAAALEASISCAQANLDLALQMNGAGMQPLNKLIELLNLLMSMAGLPELGKVSLEGDASAAIDGLNIAVGLLENVCAKIPV